MACAAPSRRTAPASRPTQRPVPSVSGVCRGIFPFSGGRTFRTTPAARTARPPETASCTCGWTRPCPPPWTTRKASGGPARRGQDHICGRVLLAVVRGHGPQALYFAGSRRLRAGGQLPGGHQGGAGKQPAPHGRFPRPVRRGARLERGHHHHGQQRQDTGIRRGQAHARPAARPAPPGPGAAGRSGKRRERAFPGAARQAGGLAHAHGAVPRPGGRQHGRDLHRHHPALRQRAGPHPQKAAMAWPHLPRRGKDARRSGPVGHMGALLQDALGRPGKSAGLL